jgi:hypothetical protein
MLLEAELEDRYGASRSAHSIIFHYSASKTESVLQDDTKFHNETKFSAGWGEEQLPIAGTVGHRRHLLWCGDEEH